MLASVGLDLNFGEKVTTDAKEDKSKNGKNKEIGGNPKLGGADENTPEAIDTVA